LEEVSTEKPGKSKTKRRRYQTPWEKEFPWMNGSRFKPLDKPIEEYITDQENKNT